MVNGITLLDGDYGLRAIIAPVWSPEMADYLRSSGVVEVELNHGKGWHGSDVSFLAELPQLQACIIIAWNMPSVDPIHCLHELRFLKVMTYCKTEIRFSAFPQLEHCTLEWRPKATSLFDCATLKKLCVIHYKGHDVMPFGKLVNLESLQILTAPVANLHGFATLKKLRELRLASLRKLTSLAGIEELANLEDLTISTCRSITSIHEVAALSKLKVLNIGNDGDIESLKPIEKLDTLERVFFSQSTNILDGDLSPLTRLRNLRRVAFRDRPHYSHRDEEFPDTYSR